MKRAVKKIVSAIILAAGAGTRMGADVTKQKIEILQKPLLSHTLAAFDAAESVAFITVVTRSDEVDFAERCLSEIKKPHRIVVGGMSRAESARLGFYSLNDTAPFVAVHDAARCLVSPSDIDRVADAALTYGCASATLRVVDTVKRIDADGFISATEDREYLKRAATPQIFDKKIYSRAIVNNTLPDEEITDDNILVQMLGEKIACVDTDPSNIKVTEGVDLHVAESILSKRSTQEVARVGMRIGHGYDVHKLVEGRRLIIGGVEIPYEKGLLGHSDADVLIHAIMDALLGAAALGDIGRHFPDSNAEYKGISSMELLARVKALLSDAGFTVVNVDATLVLQAPKIAPYIEKMRENIALALNIPSECVNVKATTEEKLGFTGSGEGAAAHAVALVNK